MSSAVSAKGSASTQERSTAPPVASNYKGFVAGVFSGISKLSVCVILIGKEVI